jgi:16S rRNA (cytosine967-C5)-methyltransferase
MARPINRRPKTQGLKTPELKPVSPDPRRAALTALDRVLEHGEALEPALASAPGYAALAPRDRAFARLLTATVLRRLGETNRLIDALIERPLPARARSLRHLMALGIVQLVHLKTPAHAAVATSVDLADRLRLSRFKGLVNAVLRRCAREEAALNEGLDAARVNTPDWLWHAWTAAYGEEIAHRIATAHLTEPPLDLTARDPDDRERLATLLEAEVLATGSLRRAPGGAISDLAEYDDGTWWVQDAGAALPVRLLGDVRGKRILDLCAAPGGKTLQLAGGGAMVTAVDQSAERLGRLASNLNRAGLSAELVSADGRSFDAAPFDGVLLDAPCSATGTIRRHPDIAWTKTIDDVTRLDPLQAALLTNAARLTRPGGTLVYAVCSLQPEEGAAQIDAFLGAHDEFARAPVTATDLGGLAEAVSPAGDLRSLPSMLPTQGGLDGFYAARLLRSGEAAT